MKLLFIGDVVGSIGRQMVTDYLPRLKKKYKPQVTILNGENAAGGRGITEKIYKQFLQDGADMITLGNHSWDNQDIFNFIDKNNNIIRPANYPQETTPGKGYTYLNVNGKKLAIINLQGRTFMQAIDDPFKIIEDILKEVRQETNLIFIDFHAETTSEKLAMAWHLDGRISALVGTHTHVQTNDNRILPQGTAYLTDVGMTGPYDAILGMQKERVIQKFVTGLPVRFEVEKEGRPQLSACLIDIHPETGKANAIETIKINPDHRYEF